MRGTTALIVSAATLLASCGSTGSMDLGTNEWLYRGSGYQARTPGDRPVFVGPIRDVRIEPDPQPAGKYTVSYYPDDRWVRPPAQMIDDVVRRELVDSGVFSEVSARPWSNGCTADVELLKFDVASEMHVTGWKSFAALAITVEVRGPLTSGGDRPLLLREEFGEAQHSEVSWDPPPAAELMSSNLTRVTRRLVAALDQLGAGRSADASARQR